MLVLFILQVARLTVTVDVGTSSTDTTRELGLMGSTLQSQGRGISQSGERIAID